ncbi:hypothetical protein N7527_009617 [Penicillium freii]|nr:hypothetical protein N7527_009617 [Penicillium freii]
MHIENFISADERAYLLSLRYDFRAPTCVPRLRCHSKESLHPSKIRLENGTAALDSARNSSSAFLPWFDPVAQCIMHRAAELQGFVRIGAIENLQITAYEQGQKYSPHFDWFEEWTLPKGRSNRASTFFAILEADCTDCGTRFPRLQVDWSARDARWCNFVDCNSTQGLTIEAVPGAALFWRNIDSGGVGNKKTLHEGLPVNQGSKIGLNIWTHGS